MELGSRTTDCATRPRSEVDRGEEHTVGLEAELDALHVAQTTREERRHDEERRRQGDLPHREATIVGRNTLMQKN